MTDMQILMAFITAGFTALGTLMLYLHNSLVGRIDKLEARIDSLREEVKDIDRRLCRIEGAMMNKECCMLRHEHKEKAK